MKKLSIIKLQIFFITVCLHRTLLLGGNPTLMLDEKGPILIVLWCSVITHYHNLIFCFLTPSGCQMSLVGFGVWRHGLLFGKETSNWCWTWLSQPWSTGSCFPSSFLAHSLGVKILLVMSCQSSVSAKWVWCSPDPTTPRVHKVTQFLLHLCPRLTIKESLSGSPTEPWNVVIRSVATSYFQPFWRYVTSKSWRELISSDNVQTWCTVWNKIMHSLHQFQPNA